MCGDKFREEREFEPQLSLFDPTPTGIPKEMMERIKAFRDEPRRCERHKGIE